MKKKITSQKDDSAAHLSLDQFDHLKRLQLRILQRSLLINNLLSGETFVCDTDSDEREEFSMGEALASMLDDVAEAARGISTVLTEARPEGAKIGGAR